MFSFLCCEETAPPKDDTAFMPDAQAVIPNDERGLEVIVEDDSGTVPSNVEPDVKDETPSVVETAAPLVVETAVVEPVAKDEPMDVSPIVEGVQPTSAEPASASLPEKFTLEVQLKQGLLGAKFDGITVVDVTAQKMAALAGIKKGYKVSAYAGESVPEGQTAKELSNWLLLKLQGPRPAVVQFDPPVLDVKFADGPLGVKFQGVQVIEVTPGQQADKAGVKVGSSLLRFGSERVPSGKTDPQLVEWLGQRLAEPRPVVVKFNSATP